MFPPAQTARACPQPGNRDHDCLDVVGGDPAARGGLGVGEVGGRRRVHGDRGGHPRERELVRDKRIVVDRGCVEVGECVKDGCFGSHGALPGYYGTRGCWPRGYTSTTSLLLARGHTPDG